MIGVPVTTIEAFGASSLVMNGNNYYLYTGGSGPSLKLVGAAVVQGQIVAWAQIGVEATAGGYEVAWKNGSADQYTVWNTDSSGNYLNNAIATVSGSSAALESLETSFHQDLNRDGTIGIPASQVASPHTVPAVTVNCDTFIFQYCLGTLS